MKVVRILITDASGYVGQFLLESFLASSSSSLNDDGKDGEQERDVQYHIYAIDPSEDQKLKAALEKYQQGQEENSSAKSSVIHIDALDTNDPGQVNEYLKRKEIDNRHPIDVCIHVPARYASPRACCQHPDEARGAMIPAPLFDAMFATSPNSAVIAESTDQVYDGTRSPYGDDPDEKSAGGTNPLNRYGQTKLDMENYLIEKMASSSCPSLHLLRCSLILGPKAPFFGDGQTFLHFIAGREGKETDFYVDEIRNAVSVRDVVRIIRRLVDIVSGAGEKADAASASTGGGAVHVCNVGGPEPLNRYEMALRVFQHLGYDSRVVVSAHKSQEQQGENPPPAKTSIQTPNNVTMSSDKIKKLADIHSDFKCFHDVLVDTFGPPK